MADTHRGTNVRDDTVEFVVMKLLLVALFVAFIAKAFEDERRWTVTGNFLHATGKPFDVEDQKSRKHLEGD